MLQVPLVVLPPSFTECEDCGRRRRPSSTMTLQASPASDLELATPAPTMRDPADTWGDAFTVLGVLSALSNLTR